MSSTDAEKYIERVSEINSIKWLSLSGGEPFLFPKLLKSCISSASNLGFSTEVVTNGFWGKTVKSAKYILDDLLALGLDVINLSIDDFHQKYIPLEKVLNCYKAAKEVGLKIVILSTFKKRSRLTLDKIIEILGRDEVQIIGGPKIKEPFAIAIKTEVVPVGRGEKISREDLAISNLKFSGPCVEVLRDIGIDPRGEVLPCCNALSQLSSIGNLNYDSLYSIIQDSWNESIFQILATKGPEKLCHHLDCDRTKYVNRCHMCHDILKSLSGNQESDPFSLSNMSLSNPTFPKYVPSNK